MGLKYKFNHSRAIFAEATFRYTLTDQLDHSKILSKDVKLLLMLIFWILTGGSLLQSGNYYAVSKEREAEFIKKRNIGDGRSNDWINTFSLGLIFRSEDLHVIVNNMSLIKEKINSENFTKHVAIIMDGNGRWAKSRGEEKNFRSQKCY